MGLVIDTNVFIDVQTGRFALERLADFAHYGEGYIAAITVSELLAGQLESVAGGPEGYPTGRGADARALERAVHRGRVLAEPGSVSRKKGSDPNGTELSG